jgi:hypothetical protein
MNRYFQFILLFISVSLVANAQNDPAWDNTSKNTWNPLFKVVEISSSVDGKLQKAYLYSSQSKTPKPLIEPSHMEWKLFAKRPFNCGDFGS